MNKLFVSIIALSFFFLVSCSNSDSKQSPMEISRGDEIIGNAIRAMGGEILDRAELTFDFRDQSLSYYNFDGQFRFTRKFPDTAGHIISDTLTNDIFIRYKDGKKLDLTPQQEEGLQEGVNSIIYFAFLPYRLLDPAVVSEHMGQVTIKDKPYEKVKVTFQKEGGGSDYEDVYYYYFDPSDYSLDYLAYNFLVNDGGIRFRSAYNERTIGGLTVRDYVNYAADPDSVDYDRIEEYYNNDALLELSRIELENIALDSLQSS